MKLNPIKFKKASKILRILVNILFWVTIISGVFFIFTSLIILLTSNDFNLCSKIANVYMLSFNGILSYTVNTDLCNISKLKSLFFSLIPLTVFSTSIMAIILRQIMNILRSIENDTPFEVQNSKRLLIIGIVLLIGSVVLNLGIVIAVSAMIKIYQIPNMHVKLSFDGIMLFTGILVLILAGLFRYGNYLQNEYDTTI